MYEILLGIIFGIVEGITEWLPISSTGHMILLNEFMGFRNVSEGFTDLFIVVIQLGAIFAVVLLYWNKLFPFSFHERSFIKADTFMMWFKIIIAIIPSAVIGILFDEKFNELFYNYTSVALALIIIGILFIIIENRNAKLHPAINSISEITFQTAFIIGLFQLIAAIFPGTSRSGATIIGAILFGVSRSVATEFTFFLAVPTMLGASLLKIVKYGLNFTPQELMILFIGMVVAFFVSIVVIKMLTGYIKKHDFKAFGWYRIVLGCAVLTFFIGRTFA
jgi:undecaprenyl-diphosphatase